MAIDAIYRLLIPEDLGQMTGVDLAGVLGGINDFQAMPAGAFIAACLHASIDYELNCMRSFTRAGDKASSRAAAECNARLDVLLAMLHGLGVGQQLGERAQEIEAKEAEDAAKAEAPPV